MNVVCSRHDDNLPILFVDFNQDFTSIQVGTKSGYSLLSTVGDEITESLSATGDPICIVGRLFNRSLVTLVSQNNMRKLLVLHSRINTLICDYQYTLTILAVRMNHQRLVVCVEDGIFIHNISDMRMLHRVEETPPNRNGVIALSSAEDTCYLAYPGSHRVGMVYIFDAFNFQNVTSIAAHDGLLAALAFNASATLLATASEKGTVIRVFSIPQGNKLMEFRRGLSRCVSICSLSFSLNNQFLVAASHTETLHVFKLENRSPTKNAELPQRPRGRHRTVSSGSSASQGSGVAGVEDADSNTIAAAMSANQDEGSAGDRNSPLHPENATSWGQGLVGWVGTTLKAYSSYLPQQVSEIFTQDRAFAYARIPGGSFNFSWAPTEKTSSGGQSSTGTATAITTTSSATSELSACSANTAGLISQPMGMHKVAAVVYYQKQPRLIVAGLDGLVHTFTFDPINGGEATLLRTQRLISPNPSGHCPRPIGQGRGPQSTGDTGGVPIKEPIGPHLTGGPQHPGVYVANRSTPTSFAGVVAGHNNNSGHNDDSN